jgi:hypothetical protein
MAEGFHFVGGLLHGRQTLLMRWMAVFVFVLMVCVLSPTASAWRVDISEPHQSINWESIYNGSKPFNKCVPNGDRRHVVGYGGGFIIFTWYQVIFAFILWPLPYAAIAAIHPSIPHIDLSLAFVCLGWVGEIGSPM